MLTKLFWNASHNLGQKRGQVVGLEVSLDGWLMPADIVD